MRRWRELGCIACYISPDQAGTEMPRYSTETKAQRTDVLDGDGKKQFDAIWQHLHQK